MRIFSIIFGILLVIFGITCIWTPVATSIDLSILLIIMAGVYGIIGIIGGIVDKHYGIGFVFSIISLVFALVMLFVPYMFAFTNVVVLSVFACWIVVMGVISIVSALQISKVTESKMWILKAIVGLIAVGLGIYAFLHPMIFGLSIAWVIGVIVGVLFMETGFSLMFMSSKSE